MPIWPEISGTPPPTKKDAKENGADAVHRYGEGSNMAP